MSLTAVFYVLLYFGLIFRSLTGNPLHGLYAYIMTIYMYAPGSWWGGGLPDLRWSLLSALVTLISIFMHIEKRRTQLAVQGYKLLEGPWYASPTTKLFMIFVVWVWIQNGWAIDSRVHSEYSVMVTKFLLLIFLINKAVLTKDDFGHVLFAHIMGCAFFGYLGLSHSSGRFESAPTPGMSDGNLLSIHMSPFLIGAGFLLLIYEGKKRYFVIPFLVLTLNAIFLTQSRGALVGLAAAAFMLLFFVPKHKKKMLYFFGGLALLGGSALMGQELINRLQTTTSNPDTGQMEASAESRIHIINAQIDMFKDQPIIGYGHYATLFLSPKYLDERWMTSVDGGSARGSHNLTMSIFVDHGLIGVFFYFGSIIWVFLKLLSFRSKIRYDKHPVYLLLLASCLGLWNLMVSAQFANAVRLEVVVWVLALCGLIIRFSEAERANEKLQSAKFKKEVKRT